MITIDRQPPAPSHIAEGIILPTAAATASQSETQVSTADRGGERKIEVIKSLVYGGLAESITSLSVVSSAAGSGATTCKHATITFAFKYEPQFPFVV